jgi:hypothetical protein
MSDESLELAIEYHREVLNGMLSEREQRKAEYMHRYANVKTVYPTTIDGATSGSTTVKRTRTISSNKAAATANGLIQSLQAGGMNAAQILAMMEKIAAQAGVKK